MSKLIGAAMKKMEANEDMTDQIRSNYYMQQLHRQLFHLWGYIAQEGLWEEACGFVNEHQDIPSPFESWFITNSTNSMSPWYTDLMDAWEREQSQGTVE